MMTLHLITLSELPGLRGSPTGLEDVSCCVGSGPHGQETDLRAETGLQLTASKEVGTSGLQRKELNAVSAHGARQSCRKELSPAPTLTAACAGHPAKPCWPLTRGETMNVCCFKLPCLW